MLAERVGQIRDLGDERPNVPGQAGQAPAVGGTQRGPELGRPRRGRAFLEGVAPGSDPSTARTSDHPVDEEFSSPTAEQDAEPEAAD